MFDFRVFKKLKIFDAVTEFRLINAFLVAVGMAILAPIIVTLKGLFLAVWVISIFSIATTLAVKANHFMTNTFTISQLYKMGIFIHLMLISVTGLYFFSPVLMIWLDSTLVIMEIAVFSSYSILLNNYLTDHFPKSMQEFQVIRNSSWADGFMIGLITVTVITYFSTIGTALIFFMIYNLLFSAWMIYNWNFYKNIEKQKG